MDHMIIDMYCHWLPMEFYKAALKCSNSSLHMLKRARSIPVMANIKERKALMDDFAGYCQIPTLVSPPLEYIAGPEKTPELARTANDSMAENADKYRNYFPGFVAALPMNNPEAAASEAERAVKDLGACGVQIFTNVNGYPIDKPEYREVFHVMADMNLPVWLHPARGMNVSDYKTEEISKYELWWTLGWPYETSMAMARLVFDGIFEKWPNLKIITHHAGGMIPMMEGRLGPGMELFGTRTPSKYKSAVETSLTEKPVDAFRRFYADTASFGSRCAIECGACFFGTSHMVFASDMPFDPEQGPGYIQRTLKAIDEMDISSEDKVRILCKNAKTLLKLD